MKSVLALIASQVLVVQGQVQWKQLGIAYNQSQIEQHTENW